MHTRRGFMRLVGGLAAAVGLGKFWPATAEAGHAPANGIRFALPADGRPESPIDPDDFTPVEIATQPAGEVSSPGWDRGDAYFYGDLPPIKGEPGRTFFAAPGTAPPKGMHVFFDGEDVHNRCRAADLSGGWCQLYPETDGRIGFPAYVARGKVELLPDWFAAIKAQRDADVREYERRVLANAERHG